MLAAGHAARGSTRAISFAFFSFQASELGKVLLILALSALVVERSRALRERDTTVRVMIAALIPAMFVIAQPDLGSGIVYMVVAYVLLFVAGTPWRHLAALAALVAVSLAFVLAAAPAAGVHVLKPYQVARLTAFLHPSSNPQKEGYQQQESKIAIGAGEKTGRGTNASQIPNGFVPESQTDFVFAAVGEQYGFVGAGIVLLLYALLIWRGLRILVMSKDLFGTLIAAGVVAMLMFQVFVNVGMTIGIMPITGVTLPLMSYGGSSVITTLLAVGLLQVDLCPGARLGCTEGPRPAPLEPMQAEHPAPDPRPPATFAHAGLAPRPAHPRRKLRRRLRAVPLGPLHLERLDHIEKASTRQRRPRGDARRAAGGERHARRRSLIRRDRKAGSKRAGGLSRCRLPGS